MKRTLAAVAASVLLLAGCGGGTHHAQVHTAAHAGPAGATSLTRLIAGHACSPASEAMQCVLPPAPDGVASTAPTATAYGVDFAWSCPSPSGHGFGASYLSDSTKDWTTSCLDAWHRAGAKTVAVWETAGTRTLDGCTAGAADARAAAVELASLDAPAGQPFDMAIDFDPTSSQLSAIGSYFRCALAAEPGRVNAYGGYTPLLYLSQHGDVGHLNWQTYAWSGGLWLPASIAPLEQYLNGAAVDDDRAVAPDYGQWPYTAPKPSPYAIFPARRILIYGQRVSERNTVATWWAHGCENPVHREVCRTTRVHLVWLAGRLAVLAEQAELRRSPAQPTRQYDWAPDHWGARHYRIERILRSR